MTGKVKTGVAYGDPLKSQETAKEIARKALQDLDIFDEENDLQNVKQVFFAINSCIKRHHEILYHDQIVKDQQQEEEAQQEFEEEEPTAAARASSKREIVDSDPIMGEIIDEIDENNSTSVGPTGGLENIPFEEALSHFRKRFELKQHRFLNQKKTTRLPEELAETEQDHDDIIDHLPDEKEETSTAETNMHDRPLIPARTKSIEHSPSKAHVILKAEVETQTTHRSPPPAPVSQSKTKQVHVVDSATDPVEELLPLSPALTTTSVSSSSPNYTPSPIRIEIPRFPNTSEPSSLGIGTKRSDVFALDLSNCSRSELSSEDEKMSSFPASAGSMPEKKGPSVTDIPSSLLSLSSSPVVEDDHQLGTMSPSSTELSPGARGTSYPMTSPSVSSSSVDDKPPASPPLSSCSSSSLSLSCYDMSKELWDNIQARQHRRQGDQFKPLKIATTEVQIQTEKKTLTTIGTSPLALDVSIYKGSPLSSPTSYDSRNIEWELDLSNFDL